MVGTLVLPLALGISIDLNDILGMHYWASDQFNPAQLITYMFMHGSFEHIFSTCLPCLCLEPYWNNFGDTSFMIYYLVTGVGAALVQQLFWTIEYQPVVNALTEAIETGSKESLLLQENLLSRFFRINDLAALDTTSLIELKHLFVNLPVTIGASGAIFGLLLAFGWLFPDAKLMIIFFPIPIP